MCARKEKKFVLDNFLFGVFYVYRYKRAKALKVGVALSTPYIDAFGAGIVITLSQAIFEGR